MPYIYIELRFSDKSCPSKGEPVYIVVMLRKSKELSKLEKKLDIGEGFCNPHDFIMDWLQIIVKGQ